MGKKGWRIHETEARGMLSLGCVWNSQGPSQCDPRTGPALGDPQGAADGSVHSHSSIYPFPISAGLCYQISLGTPVWAQGHPRDPRLQPWFLLLFGHFEGFLQWIQKAPKSLWSSGFSAFHWCFWEVFSHSWMWFMLSLRCICTARDEQDHHSSKETHPLNSVSFHLGLMGPVKLLTSSSSLQIPLLGTHWWGLFLHVRAPLSSCGWVLWELAWACLIFVSEFERVPATKIKRCSCLCHFNGEISLCFDFLNSF